MTNIANNRILNNLIIFIVLFASMTGLTLVDFIGMNIFWGIFILTSLFIVYLIFRTHDLKREIKLLFKSKLNILLSIYLLWTSISYMLNYQGKSTLLYIFKMWFIIVIFIFVFNIYISKLSEKDKNDLVLRLCKWIFFIGLIHTFFGFYQYLTLSNNFLGFILTEWPPYNPSSMYGNVNGLGTYLFLSIAAGTIHYMNNSNLRTKYFILFLLIGQMYMLYLTVARTSIIATIVYIFFNLINLAIWDRKRLKIIFNKKSLGTILAANLIFVAILQYTSIIGFINIFDKSNSQEGRNKRIRSASEMLEEKNSKGVNNRQFIWQAVINDYDEYILFGDGLKYNIIEKINVEKVISERSKGATRISYHNTLFRYFASNGLLGLIIFLFVYAFVPISLLFKMIKDKTMNIRYMNIIILLGCIFLYMQMEEVYFGEIGFIQLITLILMVIGNRYIKNI